MRISSVRVTNFKSLLDTGNVPLGQINVLVGRNNHGKSAFIRAIHLLQQGAEYTGGNVRIGAQSGEVSYDLMDISGPLARNQAIEVGATFQVTVKFSRGDTHINFNYGSHGSSASPIPPQEPSNFIYTYLSKRKVIAFDQVVNQGKTLAVRNNLEYLVSKVARLANPDHPKALEYAELCNKLLGFRISALPSPGGQQAGIPVGPYGQIPIEDMGEGVSSLLGLITDLCMANGNLFLIEEPENDIHPEGLKTLLNIIAGKSQKNQFIVSTHSNIVTRYLGAAADSKIFEFESTYNPNEVPTSTIREVEPSAEARIAVLRRLGYELSDFDLWDGWLILEESSAEIIIRYLIPWFVPGLARVRTVAAGGTSKVEATFEDFRRLFLFAHLEPQYRGRAWVIVDGDDKGTQIMENLREKYRDWPPEHFINWSNSDFEFYYPSPFSERAPEVLAKSHHAKRLAKKQLLDEVKAWCAQDPTEARAAFANSAAEVINALKAIDERLSVK